jgi:hypothetical protein
MILELDLEKILDCVAFEKWLYQAQKNGFNHQEIQECLNKSVIPYAIVRLALYCLWRRDFDSCKSALLKGYLTNNKDIQFFCKMLALFFEMYETHRLPAIELQTQYTEIHLKLLQGLEITREKKDRMKFDIELELYFLFGMPMSSSLNWKEKIKYAEEGLFSANLLGCNFYKEQFKTQIAVLNLPESEGNPNETIRSLITQLEDDLFALNSEWQVRNLAYKLYGVTNFKQAFQTLSQASLRYGNTSSLSGAYQLIAISSGNLIVENSDDILRNFKSQGRYQNLLYNISLLSKTYCMRIDRSSIAEYKNILSIVIQNFEDFGQSSDPWILFYHKWCCAVAYLKLGKLSFALKIANELVITNTFSFDERLLKLGLLLEISLQINSRFKPERIINEFMLLFSDYRKAKFSSLIGASEFLFRWHPKAAIILSLLPGCPSEFLRWQEAIVNCQKTPYVYARSIPTAYFEECVVRNFGFDVQGDNRFTFATLNLRDQKRKHDLIKPWGEILLVSPVISSAFCIYALKKMDSMIIQDVINDVILRYGLFSNTLKNSPNIGFAKDIVELVEKLAKNLISVSDFDIQILEL